MDEKTMTGAQKVDDVESSINVTQQEVVGTIKLIRNTEVVLVPTPSNDPNGEFKQVAYNIVL
jgi:DNA-binding cell septation regulator SpoVG